MSRHDVYSEYYDYTCMNHNDLDPIDKEDFPTAVEGARNEAPLLKSIYNHPDCFTAKGFTGRDHVVVAVFDTLFGGKATVVKPVDDIVLANRAIASTNSNSDDDENGNSKDKKDVSYK